MLPFENGVEAAHTGDHLKKETRKPAINTG
jgi:hypothetical protein